MKFTQLMPETAFSDEMITLVDSMVKFIRCFTLKYHCYLAYYWPLVASC